MHPENALGGASLSLSFQMEPWLHQEHSFGWSGDRSEAELQHDGLLTICTRCSWEGGLNSDVGVQQRRQAYSGKACPCCLWFHASEHKTPRSVSLLADQTTPKHAAHLLACDLAPDAWLIL